MSRYTDTLLAWAHRTDPTLPESLDGAEVIDVHVEHEDAWGSDSGTGWPANTTVVIVYVKRGRTGQRRRREARVAAPGNPEDFLRDLLGDDVAVQS